jgi:hypothetical protein
MAAIIIQYLRIWFYNRNYEKLTVPLGAEMWILPAMALRIGTQINDPANPFSGRSRY